MAFIPAYIMLLPEKSLDKFGLIPGTEEEESKHLMTRILSGVGLFTFKHAKLVMILSTIIIAISVYGISQININDNPIKWFEPEHPIRESDRVLNRLLGGTYMAYLVLEPEANKPMPKNYIKELKKELEKKALELQEFGVSNSVDVFNLIVQKGEKLSYRTMTKDDLMDELETYVSDQGFEAEDDMIEAWDEALLFLNGEKQKDEVFKNPEILKYMQELKSYLTTIKNQKGERLVGKSNTLADIVKTVYRELMGGSMEHFRIPGSSNAVAQSLLQFQNSHRPQDLWHFVTPDYRKTNLWIQLKSGNNMDMEIVTTSIAAYLKAHPAPIPLKHNWFGKTYINVAWQNKMVKGMLEALVGSFIAVLVMMVFLFRSVLWGILCMIPLTITITFIYGIIGIIGKDYDMPVAVLSSLSLGLAVDYSIHFLARSRQMHQKFNTWKDTIGPMFGEPARAITRNVLVIGIGFMPLLIAPLVPYQTVGVFIAAILVTAGVATLIVLPSMITLLNRFLFQKE